MWWITAGLLRSLVWRETGLVRPKCTHHCVHKPGYHWSGLRGKIRSSSKCSWSRWLQWVLRHEDGECFHQTGEEHMGIYEGLLCVTAWPVSLRGCVCLANGFERVCPHGQWVLEGVSAFASGFWRVCLHLPVGFGGCVCMASGFERVCLHGRWVWEGMSASCWHAPSPMSYARWCLALFAPIPSNTLIKY